jgi:hypothetical protein
MVIGDDMGATGRNPLMDNRFVPALWPSGPIVEYLARSRGKIVDSLD